MGNSTGSHLHIEVIKKDQYLNPIYFVVTDMTATTAYLRAVRTVSHFLIIPAIRWATAVSLRFSRKRSVFSAMRMYGAAAARQLPLTALGTSYIFCDPAESPTWAGRRRRGFTTFVCLYQETIYSQATCCSSIRPIQAVTLSPMWRCISGNPY